MAAARQARVNGITDSFLPDVAVVAPEGAEVEDDMAAAKQQESFATGVARQVAVAAIVAALTCGLTLWANNNVQAYKTDELTRKVSMIETEKTILYNKVLVMETEMKNNQKLDRILELLGDKEKKRK